MEDRGLGKRLLSITKSPTAFGFPPRRIPSSSTLSAHALDWVASLPGDDLGTMAGFRTSPSATLRAVPRRATADFLARPSADNYEIADPYLKWHVAQDAVNKALPW